MKPLEAIWLIYSQVDPILLKGSQARDAPQQAPPQAPSTASPKPQ